MANTLIRIRKDTKVPAWATGPEGWYIQGDICGIHPYTLEPTDRERTSFAWVRITDIPAAIAQKAQRWIKKEHYVSDVLTSPRIINIDVPLLKAEYPSRKNEINKLFDPTFTLPLAAIPEFTWTKFRMALWDKINVRVVPETQWETDPPEDP